MPFSSPLIHTHYSQHIGNQVIANSCLKGVPLCLEIECETKRVLNQTKTKLLEMLLEQLINSSTQHTLVAGGGKIIHSRIMAHCKGV